MSFPCDREQKTTALPREWRCAKVKSAYLFFSSEEASISLNSPAMWTIP